MTDRVADSTIKGFLYQFNKSILEIIMSDDDDLITIEGVLEDVDILSANGEMEAIQCKYHEGIDKFVPSVIFKPLLQMAEAYDKTPSSNIKYTIYIHIPSSVNEVRKIEISDLNAALETTDKNLIKIVNRISKKFDKNKFLENISLVFGPSLDDLEIEVKNAIASLKIEGGDVDTLLYPNSIEKVSKISSLKDESLRKITKKQLFDYLSSATYTAASVWTLSLKNRSEILRKIKQQLSVSFGKNSRDRYFYINKNEIKDYSEKIVVFISNYVGMYYSKPTHLKVPTFVINDDFEGIKDLEHRLYKKNIKANTGVVGNSFEIEYFFKEPIRKIVRNKIVDIDFNIRLLALKSAPDAINHKKGDDFYIVCSSIPIDIDFNDINLYQVGTNNFSELEYVIGMRNSHE
ncbi:MAG: hypothetical protein AAGC78_18240 [Cellvibrio sp.]|uniref:hypothetical protein n=1 Tax=Cellvibrio sp. TaxID=1965322 RepID=UPI0031ABB9E3